MPSRVAFRRQRDDRLAAREPDARGPAGGDAAPRRRRPVGVRRRRGVTASSRCIARPTSTTRTRWGRCSPCCATSASGCRSSSRCIRARAPTSSASASAALVVRRADRRAAAAGLSRDARADGGRDARAHRLRRHAGGDHGARRPVPDAAREHRAPDHRSSRAPTRWSAGTATRSSARSTRSWRAAASAGACRSSGTGARPSGSPRISPTGSRGAARRWRRR